MLTGKGYSGNMFVGSKYNETSDLNKTELAKVIRAELKAKYPKIKFSVTKDSNSIDVKIVDVDFNPFSNEYNAFLKSNEKLREWNKNSFSKWDATPTYNEKFETLRKEVKSIMDQYNFDDSDTMTDYFHVRFYGDVRLNETAYIQKFHPNHIETNERVARDQEWEANRKAKNAAIKERKEKVSCGFKKGETAFYTYNYESHSIPKGVYECTILKVPNGRATLSTISIRFKVDKKFDANRNVVDRMTPAVYTAEIFDIKLLKPTKDKQRKNAIKDFLENA
jgi:hypothetical protein